jgi:adenylate kinase
VLPGGLFPDIALNTPQGAFPMSTRNQNDRAAWLQGAGAECSTPLQKQGRAWRLILIGAPGVGKGTQAAMLSEHLRACHLSTGDLFRSAMSNNTNQTLAMLAALDFMRRGDLVPDDIAWGMVRERIDCLRCRVGFILDGFPRTLAQADSLKRLMERELLPLDAALNYVVPLEETVARLSGRRVCESCKTVFHLTARPPMHAGMCDHCRSRLCQREDDRPESIAVRLEAYDRSTAPLIQFYENLGALATIDATGSPAEIFSRTMIALQGRRINDESRGTTARIAEATAGS